LPMNFRTIGEPHNDCMFYVQSEMIWDEKHVLRGKLRRHNKHAPPTGSQRYIPEPNLMVSRHIRNGEDINDDS
jgi:hypothetical protein